MVETVLVWWLVLGGSGNAGSSWSPVPYQEHAVCMETARIINEEVEYPVFGAICVAQPAADVELYGNQFYGSLVWTKRYGR